MATAPQVFFFDLFLCALSGSISFAFKANSPQGYRALRYTEKSD
ncbi:hypothetical protein GARC_4637 [Paraglaciecola arctica BSs20135]|uniref:Uncharacterized protein n=1 Tax=Paraglaciecola arctica BSs20135 TaxID=493475 RepID=K6XLP6_9ALTE|nr:hypothetical protein GARC_4637 [Paraglaciecola arctica BSs20135]